MCCSQENKTLKIFRSGQIVTLWISYFRSWDFRGKNNSTNSCKDFREWQDDTLLWRNKLLRIGRNQISRGHKTFMRLKYETLKYWFTTKIIFAFFFFNSLKKCPRHSQMKKIRILPLEKLLEIWAIQFFKV